MKSTMKALFFACFILFTSATEVIERGFVDDRSGSIIIAPDNIQDDSFAILRDGFVQNGEIQKIKDTDFAEIISYQVGGPLLSSEPKSDSLSKNTLFEKSRANVMVVINGVGQDDINTLNLRMLHGKKLKIVKTAYPQDDVSTITTLVTGVTPSQHGIPSRIWRSTDGTVVAYKSDALRTSQSVADYISQTFEGKALTAALSYDFQISSALAAHQHVAQGNDFGLYFDLTHATFESIYNTPISELQISEKFLTAQLAARTSFFTVDTFKKTATIVLNDKEVVFDLASYVDSVLFTELEYFLTFVEKLSSSETLAPLVADNIPDLFSFGVSSISKLKSKYGPQSDEVRAALYIIDQVIEQLTSQLKELYGEISNEIVFNGIPISAQLNKAYSIREAVFATVFHHVAGRASFEASFPSVFTFKEETELCEQVKQVAAKYEMKAFCGDQIPGTWAGYLRETNGTNGTDTGSSSDAGTFQIILWSSIALVLTVFFVVYTVAYMDVGEDSIIYRLTSYKSHQL